MAWITLDVALEGLGNAHETSATLHATCKRVLKEADSVGNPLAKDGSNDGRAFHLTMLEHGDTEADAVRKMLAARTHPAPYNATANGFKAIQVDEKYGVIVLSLDCEPLQDLHAVLRAEARRVSGAEPAGNPHLGPHGEHCHKHDFHPHVTLGSYSNMEAMRRDYTELVLSGTACELGWTRPGGPPRTATLSNWRIY